MNSIKGMYLTKIRKKILTHLKVYAGDVHPHTSQKPVQLEL